MARNFDNKKLAESALALETAAGTVPVVSSENDFANAFSDLSPTDGIKGMSKEELKARVKAAEDKRLQALRTKYQTAIESACRAYKANRIASYGGSESTIKLVIKDAAETIAKLCFPNETKKTDMMVLIANRLASGDFGKVVNLKNESTADSAKRGRYISIPRQQ